jgi:hypothetical protein
MKLALQLFFLFLQVLFNYSTTLSSKSSTKSINFAPYNHIVPSAVDLSFMWNAGLAMTANAAPTHELPSWLNWTGSLYFSWTYKKYTLKHTFKYPTIKISLKRSMSYDISYQSFKYRVSAKTSTRSNDSCHSSSMYEARWHHFSHVMNYSVTYW